MATAHATPTAMIDRVASLLEVFEGHQRLTLAQISRRAQLPPSSAHRILQRLVELGWIERNRFEYHLGIRMFELGSQVVRRDGVHQAALPFLHFLHRTTGLTAHLSALTGADVLHLERIGAWPESGAAWRLGARQPAVHSAAGRALLAQADQAHWPAPPYPRAVSSGAVSTLAELRDDLRRIQARGGVAVDVGRITAGLTAVAAPIGPPEGGLRAALSLCGPVGVLPVDKAVSAVRRAAQDIWYTATGANHRYGRPILPLADALSAVAAG